jgi:hypothetical protein
MVCEACIELALDRVQRRALVNTAMDFRVSYSAVSYITTFPRCTLFHGDLNIDSFAYCLLFYILQ